jgi:hypothetical protein
LYDLLWFFDSFIFLSAQAIAYSLINPKCVLTPGTDDPLGKIMENSKTRAEIGWEPKYPSFTEFLGIIS